MDFDRFLKLLYQLKPSGVDGFEGLVAKLLEQFLDQSFFLSLSGRQEGRDMASDGRTGNALAVECKRYKDSTSLGSDELLVKFSAASLDRFPPDIWMVATTKRLGEQHHKQLRHFSQQSGISYFPIDAQDSEESTLATLCALSPMVVAEHLRDYQPTIAQSEADVVNKYLAGIASQSGYEERKGHLLRDLTTDNIGYAHLRQDQTENLIQALSYRTESDAYFGQDISVLDHENDVIQRQDATQKLDDWWSNWSGEQFALCILGEEGDGKSWSVSQWMANKLIDDSLPLTIFFSSGHITSTDPSTLLVEALSRQFPNETSKYWGKRLERWRLQDSSRNEPIILLIFDGVNERHDFNWCDLISKLYSSKWAGKLAIIFTSRTTYWDRHISGRISSAIDTWIVTPYNDNELNIALAHKGLSRKDFSPELIALLSKPRYFDLMVRLRELMAESGDITIERLIYEDFRDKISRKQGGKSLITHDDFQDLVTELAEAVRDNHSLRRKELNKRLEGYGDVNHLFEELLSERILVKKKGNWEVDRNNLILGLGLLLANEVWCSHIEDVEEVIASHLEPHADMDLKVAICGMAVYQGMLTDEFPEFGRLALFDAWIAGRNICEEDWQRLPAYLPLRPQTYISLAEHLWVHHNDNGFAQNVMMSGFLRYGELAKVHEVLVPAFERWFGFVHLDGDRDAKDDEELEKNRQKVAEALGETPSSEHISRFGRNLTIIEDKGLLRLSRMALAIISHQERVPFIHPLCTGVLAKTIMGLVDWADELAWILHTAPDQIENIVIDEARSLMTFSDASAQRAAWWLLTKLGTTQSLVLRNSISDEYAYKNPVYALWKEDPCNFTFWTWTHENYLECVKKTGIDANQIANMLKDVALNPVVQLNGKINHLISDVGSHLDLGLVASSRGNSREDLILEDIESTLCAFLPERYKNIIRSLVHTLPGRSDMALNLVLRRLYEHILILGKQEKVTIKESWRNTIKNINSGDELRHAEYYLFNSVLLGSTAREQMELVIERGNRFGHWIQYPPQYSPLSKEALGDIEAYLVSQTELKDNHGLYHFLWYMSRSLKKMNAAVRKEVLRIFDSADTELRRICMEFIVTIGDAKAAEHMIKSGWHHDGNDRYKNHWGNQLLSRYGDDIPLVELANRINIEFLGFAVEERGLLDEEVRGYGELLHKNWLSATKISCDLPQEASNASINTDLIGEGNKEDFLQVTDGDSNGICFKSWGSIWGGTEGSSVQDFQDASNSELRKQRLMDAYESMNNLIEQQREAGNPWFASSFNRHALPEVIDAFPQYLDEWINYAISTKETAIPSNRLGPLRGFYTKLCGILLERKPEIGVKLYERLSQDDDFRIVDRVTGIETRQFSLFRVAYSEPVNRLRKQLFDEITSDYELSDFAFLAELNDSSDWLIRFIEGLLDLGRSFDTARGLSILGFMDNDWAGEQLNIFLEKAEKSWLRDVAEQAYHAYEKNQWAKYHFNTFLNIENNLSAWAAFRLFLKCVDRRFWLQEPSMEEIEQLRPEIRDHYLSNREFIVKAIENNEKVLKKKFIWQKINEGQLWPWMGKYLH